MKWNLRLIFIFLCVLIFPHLVYGEGYPYIRVAVNSKAEGKTEYSFKSSSFNISQDQKIISALPQGIFAISLETGLEYIDIPFSTKKEAEKFTIPSIPKPFLAFYNNGAWYPAVINRIHSSGLHGIPVNSILLIRDKESNVLAINANKSIALANGEKNFSLEGSDYRGELLFTVIDKNLIPINKISVEEYLYSVVPLEISPSWNEEALKTQAIISRTFAMNKIKNSFSKPYDTCDTTVCQVYKGSSSEKSTTTRAVDLTKGLIIFDNNQPYDVYFSASNGGSINSSKIAWGNEHHRLIARSDIYSKNSSYSWSVILTNEEIEQKLKNHNYFIGDLISLHLNRDSESKRVMKITFKGTNSDVTISGEKIRATFGYEVLKSTLFFLKSPIQNNRIDQAINDLDCFFLLNPAIKYNINLDQDVLFPSHSIQIQGMGYGHGVGLSQEGAKNMADLGLTTNEIIHYYFPGSTIETIDSYYSYK